MDQTLLLVVGISEGLLCSMMRIVCNTYANNLVHYMYSCIVAIWEVQYIVIYKTRVSTGVLILCCAHYMKYTISRARFWFSLHTKVVC